MKKIFLKESNILYKEIEYSEINKKIQSIMVRRIINQYNRKNSSFVKVFIVSQILFVPYFFCDYYKLYIYNSKF